MAKNQDTTYKIRPAARLIHTIGRDLIGDSYAALVELVKNSYDADSEHVDISFEYTKIDKRNALIIIVEDQGHGMSFNTVINKWLVPATDDKLKRKTSPKGRNFQGRKGIGRFAASILGQELILTSIDEKGEKTTAVVDWRVFDSDDFLENVELLIEKENTKEEPGTTIKIVAFNEKEDEKISVWDESSIENLINELRKLISPFKDFNKDTFSINLSFENCPIDRYNNEIFEIETYPIIDLYDYRIHGSIKKNGVANLVFENNVTDIIQKEKIESEYSLENGGKYCGEIQIDFRVFDREPEAIENLINKGLIDPVTQKYAGKNDARRMLNDVYGVNIYRNHFRIRPYGNGGLDWMDLDKDRIQNFTLKISNNQIVGFISIQPEELSHLEEKSARDGLKENEYYKGLKELSQKALRELELRRLTYREKSKKGRKGRSSIQDSLTRLFSFSDLSKSIEGKLEKLDVSKENISQIREILKKEEESKAELLQDIQKTIAIYQGQATLGKIVNFILHEGRKPIQFLNSETKVIERYIRHYKATKDEEILDELDISIDGFRKNSKHISDLFKRINPLANQKRGKKENFNVNKCIEDSLGVFKSALSKAKILAKVNCSESIEIYGWREDLYTALTNLIENSIFWLRDYKSDTKKIIIDVSSSEESILIDYRDTGPGLTKSEIESDIIFEPGYSKKHNGTGLGLAIAGEAAERLSGTLKARISDSGAYFQIEIKTNEEGI
jgi:signal transduction histidine kinase